MTDIVVTLPNSNFDHLQEKIEALEDSWSWWDMGREPTKLTENDKVFVVCGRSVHGYFTISHILHEGDYSTAKAVLHSTMDMIRAVGIPMGDWIRIVFRTWQSIEEINMKGFQSFRYRKFDYKDSKKCRFGVMGYCKICGSHALKDLSVKDCKNARSPKDE